MRLYRLISRVGRRKRRPYPWFEPPAAEAPKKYYGWTWDPEIQEWVKTPVPVVDVTVSVPRYPKPSYVPSARQPDVVAGWAWSYPNSEWVATSIVGQRVTLEAPVPLPPNITVTDVHMAAISPFDIDKLITLLMSSGKSEAEARMIMTEYVRMTAGMTKAEGAEIWRHAAGAIARSWREVHSIGPREGKQVYLTNVARAFETKAGSASPAVMSAVIVLAAAVVGFLVGSILESLVFPDDDMFVMEESKRTYLMGPDEWFYSRNIGVSPAGNLFYSKCEGIGTEYVRHKRSVYGGLYDVIDFPGGFVEEGYDFPYWVKFTWDYWNIVYIGMLFSVSEDFYALKKEFISLEERARPVTTLPYEKWCTDFHWYL